MPERSVLPPDVDGHSRNLKQSHRGQTADPNLIPGSVMFSRSMPGFGAAFPERRLSFMNRGIGGNTVANPAARPAKLVVIRACSRTEWLRRNQRGARRQVSCRMVTHGRAVPAPGSSFAFHNLVDPDVLRLFIGGTSGGFRLRTKRSMRSPASRSTRANYLRLTSEFVRESAS